MGVLLMDVLVGRCVGCEDVVRCCCSSFAIWMCLAWQRVDKVLLKNGATSGLQLERLCRSSPTRSCAALRPRLFCALTPLKWLPVFSIQMNPDPMEGLNA